MPAEDGQIPLLEARELSKHYGRVQALNGVSLAIYPGEVVGLVGDNGAGKSTLVSLLSGTAQPSHGSIIVDGAEANFSSSSDARKHGIETVYQDLALAPELPIWLNFFLGRESLATGPLKWIGWMDRKRMIRESVGNCSRGERAERANIHHLVRGGG